MKKYSAYLTKKKPVAQALLDRLLERFEYASILGTHVTGTGVSVDPKTTGVSPVPISECGFVIKVFQNGYCEYSVNDLEMDDIPTLVDRLVSLADRDSAVERVRAAAAREEAICQRFCRPPVGKVYPAEQILARLTALVRQGMDTIDNVVTVRAYLEHASVSKMFLSGKKDLEQFYTWDTASCSVMVRSGDTTRMAYDSFGSNSMNQVFSHLSRALPQVGALANKLLEAAPPEPGIYEVITDPSITGLIAHEAFGHGVEMDMFVKDRAQAREFMGKQVASPLVSMHDGAAATLSAGSYFFDDDGVLAQDTTIIRDGILVNGISDLLSAMELGTQPTGNGRRQSYKRKAYTRMTNTFFEKGSDRLADMIKSVKHGYYIAVTNNGMEDPKNWGIQCTALYGREIRDGIFTGKLVSPVVMSGHVLDLLGSISAVSGDFQVIGAGSCGKGYKEWVRVSDGGPCLKAKVKIG